MTAKPAARSRQRAYAPTGQPPGRTLSPPRCFPPSAGLAASTRSPTASIAASSETCARPLASTTAFGSPPSRNTTSSTCFAPGPPSFPESTSTSSDASPTGVSLHSRGERPVSLASLATSPFIQLAMVSRGGGPGQLGELTPRLLDERVVDDERREIGLREVTVIRRVLLGAHGPRLTARGVEEARLLPDLP